MLERGHLASSFCILANWDDSHWLGSWLAAWRMRVEKLEKQFWPLLIRPDRGIFVITVVVFDWSYVENLHIMVFLFRNNPSSDENNNC